ncbi:HEAT repeat domain-containing protein [Hansschlegelia sp. KR7-227]|uniref:HEAT repeat domain-containing protein n=1 Tax=Hansschlegelia sp. KR7-227 TaxID=3400914 RepID=UPI003C125BC2
MDWSSRINTPSFEIARQGVLEGVEAFRQWASVWNSQRPPDEPAGEWETFYDDWPALNTAVIRLLQASSPAQWDAPLIEALLYAIARDNEMECIKQDLVGSPSHLIALAGHAVNCDDPDARWQLADALGSPDLSDEQVEPLLERFVHDDDEYVSRRALLALSARRSPKTEQLAVRAWETGHEYQRMVALDVLFEASSPLTSIYIDKCKSIEQEHLRARAQELSARLKTAQNARRCDED